MLQVIKFAEKVSFQSLFKCVSVSNGTQVQWQIVPRIGGRHAESALSKLQTCPWELADPISWLIVRQCDLLMFDPCSR